MMWRRRTPFRSLRDMRAEALASPVLTALRGELLDAPDEDLAQAHIEMMQLEYQLLASRPHSNARRAPRRPARLVVPRPRRSVCVAVAVCLVFASGGLDAVGALPAPLQHISDSIKHHLGIDGPTPDTPHSHPHAAGQLPHPGGPVDITATPASPQGPLAHQAPAAASVTPSAPSTIAPTSVRAVTPASSHGYVRNYGTSTGSGPGKPPPKPRPPHREMHGGGGPPPGLPADWQRQATDAAVAQLENCAQSSALAPADCPQHAGQLATTDTVHWTLLGEPLAGAVAVMQPVGIGSKSTNGAGTQEIVYGRFQMVASVVAADGTTSYTGYTGGVAQATATWDGSSFGSVTYASGPIDQLPVGVKVPGFARPSGATGTSALGAVQAGFQACAAAPTAPDAGVPNCPQHASIDPGATNPHWSLDGDPTQGAVVSFDAQHGDFTVTGTYAMTLDYDGGSVSVTGHYTATLFFDGAQLQLLTISGA